ncbi:uncharacterized protein [Danio rerio]|uniref:Uncharacterized protein n=1 Tax=Danio rerio TaxID=7955 RepID=A0AC58IW94_DANRE
MTDEQMAKYVSSYGDRLAIVSFCQQTAASSDKESLLKNLRDKIEARKLGSSKTFRGKRCVIPKERNAMARNKNSSAERTTRRIEIGWLHYGRNGYQQVRTNNGGGTRHLTVQKETTVEQIMEMGKNLFFPNGESPKGPEADFTFHVCDFKRNPIVLDSTVGNLYEQTKLKLLRFYICTKQEVYLTDEESLSEEDKDGFNDHSLRQDGSDSDTERPAASLSSHGCDSDVDHASTHLLDYRLSSNEKSKKRRVTTETQRPGELEDVAQSGFTADAPSTSYCFHSLLNDIKKAHVVQRVASSSSDEETGKLFNYSLQQSKSPQDLHEHCDFQRDCELIDLTNQIPPLQNNRVESLGFDMEETVEWREGDELGNRIEDEEIVVTWDLREEIIENAELTDAENEEPSLPLSNSHHVLQMGSEMPSTPDSLPSHLRDQISSSFGNSANLTEVQALIHRVKVVEDLLSVFMDRSIIQSTLKMEFVNEIAVDDAGVSREVYTAFWDQFLEQCEGEDERVPRLRPDFSEPEWEAVGRIWVKGFLDLGVLPVRLASAFILACMYGIDSVDDELLLSSFHNYLSLTERTAIAKAYEGTLDESDEEDLLDLFTRMGSHRIPFKNLQNMKIAIQTMAHKAILQEPKFIIDCFSKNMPLALLKIPDQKSLVSLYEKKKATGKKVAQLLQTTQDVRSQKEQMVFHHLQRYVRNADQTKAEKFLRFCTGSSVICVEQIKVSFNAESGLSRRPVAHTCGATLDLPYTYSSYPDLRTELDNILSSDCFEMNIL